MLTQPDLVLVNGRVSTMAGAPGIPPEAEAVAIRSGRITAIGSSRDLAEQRGPATQVVDLGGRRVVPGLIDSHVHFARAGLTWTNETRWEGLPSLALALARISSAAQAQPPGSWIRTMGGWHPDQFTERRPPTRADLDRAAPDHPVLVQYVYDWGLLNSTAMRVLRDLQDAPGGATSAAIDRDPDGVPTGYVRGMAALRWLYDQLPRPTLEDQVRSTAAASREFSRLGVTGLIDGGGTNSGPDTYHAVHEVCRRGQLTTRVRLTVHASAPGAEADEYPAYLRYVHPGVGDPRLRVLGLGEIVLFAVHDSEVRPPDLSPATVTQLRGIFQGFAEARWPLQIHACRSETVECILDLWEEIDRVAAIGPLRWSLVHAECLSTVTIERVRRLRAGVLTPSLFRFDGDKMLELWGEERMAESPPLRRLLQLGIPFGGGTDAMRVADYNPFLALQWYVTGRTMAGRSTRDQTNLLTRAEALHAYTRGAAWFSFEDHLRGSLEPGKVADLAVLDRDLLTVPEEEMGQTSSDLTLLDGSVVWASPALQSAVPQVGAATT